MVSMNKSIMNNAKKLNIKDYKIIPNFKDYLISKNGDIFSKKSNKKLFINIDRFKKNKRMVIVSLYNNNIIRKSKYLNKLVAMTYLPNPLNKPEIIYIDGDCYNNNANNLEWATKLEKIEYAKTKKYKIIPNFKNYLISKNGDIYSKISNRKLLINIDRFKKNKRRVNVSLLNNNMVRKGMYLHRLVAMTYLPNPQNKLEVNHIDGDCYNNNVNNLEWTTKIENMEHAKKNKLIKSSHSGRNIIQYDKNMNMIKEYDTIREASKQVNIHSTTIHNALTGKFKHAGGYIWKYKKEKIIKDEIWKDIIIDKINTRYKVSNYGRIKSKRNIIIKGHIHDSYYIIIDLRFIKDNINIRKSARLHRLVATAFLPNIANKYSEIDHIDTNPQNNNVNNLKWCTHKENMNNIITKAKLSKPVNQYDKNGKFINKFNSINDANKYMCEKYGYVNLQPVISNMCNKKKQNKTAGGYKWEFCNIK